MEKRCRILLLLPCLALAGCHGLTVARVSVVDAQTRRPVRGVPVVFTAYDWNLDFSGKNPPGQSRRESDTGRDNAVWFFTWDNTAAVSARSGYWAGHDAAQARSRGLPLPLLHVPVLFLRLEAPPVRTPVPLLFHEFTPIRRGKPKPEPPPDTPGVALDLIEGDWLPPWGEGKTADLLFTLAPQEEWEEVRQPVPWQKIKFANGRTVLTPSYSYAVSNRPTYRLSFPGEGNGLCEVEPNPGPGPRIFAAPETGYEAEIGPLRADWTSAPFLCFRIRSEHDSDGRLVSCHYGKIYGGIRLGKVWRSPPLELLPAFFYYVNPAPLDTNLEPLPPFSRQHGP